MHILRSRKVNFGSGQHKAFRWKTHLNQKCEKLNTKEIIRGQEHAKIKKKFYSRLKSGLLFRVGKMRYPFFHTGSNWKLNFRCSGVHSVFFLREFRFRTTSILDLWDWRVLFWVSQEMIEHYYRKNCIIPSPSHYHMKQRKFLRNVE